MPLTPTPTPAPRPSNAGAGVRLAPRPLSELLGGKDHTAPCRAVPGVVGGGLYLLSPHPEPLLYWDPPSFPSPSPVPAPDSAAAAAASVTAGSARL